MDQTLINCLQCNRKTYKTKSSKKFCSNRCRVKFHRIKHGHPLARPYFDPFEMIECRNINCPNNGMGLARNILKNMGCIGGCLKEGN